MSFAGTSRGGRDRGTDGPHYQIIWCARRRRGAQSSEVTDLFDAFTGRLVIQVGCWNAVALLIVLTALRRSKS